MLIYNTIFFAECQDGNEFLFHFINFAQTQVIFYSKLPSKNIPFLLYVTAVVVPVGLHQFSGHIRQLLTKTFAVNTIVFLPT